MLQIIWPAHRDDRVIIDYPERFERELHIDDRILDLYSKHPEFRYFALRSYLIDDMRSRK